MTALGQAQLQNGLWQVGILTDSSSQRSPIGSKDTDATPPRILYGSYGEAPLLGLLWREVADPISEELVPNPTASKGRWVSGTSLMILTIKVAGVSQVASYNTATKVLTQLTFDASQKDFPFMFQAPELNNDLIFTAVLDQAQIGIYYQQHDQWKLVRTINSARTDRPYIIKTQSFIYAQKSYITYALSSARDNTGLGDIWLAAVDPRLHLEHQVSAPNPSQRRDPETLFTSSDTYIYYTETIANGNKVIHRCTTGLGATP